LGNSYLAKINIKIWPLKIGSSDAPREMIKYPEKLGPNIYIFDGDMTICNYYHVIFKKVNRFHFAIVILAKKKYTGGTESRLGTLRLLLVHVLVGGIVENQNSDLVSL
jgi:hypothetical protein